MDLFGGDKEWKTGDWKASDDRVRGGKSQSYLDCSSEAHFYGNLDIKTLGGAGFASQRTTGDERNWDLSDYDQIVLNISQADSKKYTFILKDTLLDKDPETGREQSTISYEYDFQVDTEDATSEDTSISISWADLKATYRGKEKKDAPKLNTSSIKRLSIMMRSFFGDQEGDFSLKIKSIQAVKTESDHHSHQAVISDSKSGSINEHGWAQSEKQRLVDAWDVEGIESQASRQPRHLSSWRSSNMIGWWMIGGLVLLLIGYKTMSTYTCF